MTRILAYVILVVVQKYIILFIILSLVLVLFIKNEQKITSNSEYSLYAGNIGIGESIPIPTPTPDTEAPFVTVTNPINGVSVSGSVTVVAEASDSGGIAKVEFFADSSMIGTSFSAPYSSLWNTTIYQHNSIHLIHARAFDLASNVASSSAVFVTVLDVTPPNVSITNPINGSTVLKNTTVTITANASDVSGINKVEFYVNGVLKCTDSVAGYSCSWKVPKRPNITYTLQTKAFDVVGNTATSTVTVTSR